MNKEGRLIAHPALTENAVDLLDSLVGQAALVDGEGRIVAVNRDWWSFALSNEYVDSVDQQGFGLGSNYLDICETASGACSDGAGRVAVGLRDVLSGRLENFSFEYPCHSPRQKRWFKCLIRRFPSAGATGPLALVLHVDVTEQVQGAIESEMDYHRLHALSEEIGAGWWQIDLVDETIHIGARLARNVGLAGYTILPLSDWTSHILASGRHAFEDFLDAASSGADKSATCKINFRDFGKGRVHLSLIGRKIETGTRGRERIEGFAIDTTAQAEAYKVLDARDQRFNRVMDVMPFRIAYYDVSLTCRYANAEYRRGMTWIDGDVVGLHAKKLLGSSAFEIMAPRMRKALSGEQVTMEEDLVMADGSAFRAAVTYMPNAGLDGEVPGFYAIIHDVGGFKDREDVLRAAELAALHANERMELAADAANIAIWDFDIVGNRLHWDDRMYRMYGVSEAEFSGAYEAWENALLPEDRERIVSEVWTCIESGEDLHGEFQITRGDGEVRTLTVNAIVLKDAAGNPLRMVGANADVTEKRQLEERLRRSERLEAVGRLTAGIAHDFNNVLQIISGNSQLLEASAAASGEPDRSVSDQIAAIVSAVDHGAALTERLLAFSRQDSLTPRLTDLCVLVDETSGLLRGALGRSIEFAVRAGGAVPRVMVDPQRFGTAIINLAMNARDAMPGGGRLEIEIAHRSFDAPPAVVGEPMAPGPFVVVSMRDTGGGIDPAILQRVVEPFFTTKNAGEGSGLGLSMVYGFVRQSGGYMSIDSEPGKGTSISLYFPEANKTAEPERPAQPKETADGPLTGRILLVEDDPDVQAIPAAMLRKQGFEVVAVSDGAAALEAMERDRFDLLFTDMVLPGGLTGGELAEAAEQRQPGIRVLFTSGYSDLFANPAEGLVVGENLLRKPYRRAELLKCVRDLIDGGAS